MKTTINALKFEDAGEQSDWLNSGHMPCHFSFYQLLSGRQVRHNFVVVKDLLYEQAGYLSLKYGWEEIQYVNSLKIPILYPLRLYNY